MSLPLKTPGIHHIGLRCGDLEKARHFYGTLLGFKILRPAPVLMFLAGSTVIAMKGPEKDSLNTGVKADEQMNGRLYLSFKDPDGISWEFYSTR